MLHKHLPGFSDLIRQGDEDETMQQKYPFLVSVPHGGVEIPEEVADAVLLDEDSIVYFSDPGTRDLFDLRDCVRGYIDTPISRMIVDLNRPPYHLPPKRWDGVIKMRTSTGIPVFKDGLFPDIETIHALLMKYYFPYHAMVDRILGSGEISLGIDCHSMLPEDPGKNQDSARKRPLICLGNNGDRDGNPRKGCLATCPGETIRALFDEFTRIFPEDGSVAINTPFRGGFISNAHFWHMGIPWIQLEVNRTLYEGKSDTGFEELQEIIRAVLSGFWESVLENELLEKNPPK